MKPYNAWKAWAEGARIQYRDPQNGGVWQLADCEGVFRHPQLEYRRAPPAEYRIRGADDNTARVLNLGYVARHCECADTLDQTAYVRVPVLPLQTDKMTLALAIRFKKLGIAPIDFQMAYDRIEEVQP